MLYLDLLDKNTTGLSEVIFLGLNVWIIYYLRKMWNACIHFYKFYCVFNIKLFHSFDLWKPLNSEIIYFYYADVLKSNIGTSTKCFTPATQDIFCRLTKERLSLEESRNLVWYNKKLQILAVASDFKILIHFSSLSSVCFLRFRIEDYLAKSKPMKIWNRR